MQHLFGRDRELRLLEALLSGLPTHGQAMVIRGEAGIGKSALLAATAEAAHERAVLVLSMSGVPSEAQVPFASPHQLLRPVLTQLDSLPLRRREALQAAFGLTDAVPPISF